MRKTIEPLLAGAAVTGQASRSSEWPDRAVTVRAPATSANLGPGFDSFGLALTLHDMVEARVADRGLGIEVTGAGEESAGAGEDHLVVRAIRAGFAALGGQPPGLVIRCANAIPQGFGLGSSAAAIVAGLLAARALACPSGGQSGPLADAALLQLAVRLEGHPDNVAACLAGGLTIAWQPDSTAQQPDGTARVARLTPLAGIAPVICVPAEPLATSAARKVLPQQVPHADAAANSAQAALLVAALTADTELLMDATQDYLHQGYRAAAMPDTTTLISRLRAAGIPAVVSGAGPAVLALTVRGTEPGQERVAEIAGQTGAAWRLLPLEVDRQGAEVLAS